MVALALIATLTGAPGQASAKDVVVFAAASLTTALERTATAWQAETGHTAVIAPGSSASLARQIQQGAPADVFLSANVDWTDVLAEDGFILPDTRRDLWRNSLVLIAHGGDQLPVVLSPELNLSGLLGDGYLATALVESVPAGIYARTALTHLGLWDQVVSRLAQSDTVRGALAMVATGEAPFGIVYATDARIQPNVSVIATFPEDSHAPIVYPGAVITESQMPDAARAFLDYLQSPTATAIFLDHGFGQAG
ncbi:molybdate ABC transporter substrate-binding protein [Pseudoruegeria sp. SK021]|nr:molybdate ABC transporter substrate-binding protein [Pseudoruegeria sp. SK021]